MERIKRNRPEFIKRALLKGLKELENARSKFVVEKFRSQLLSEHFPNSEIPSNPIQKLNYINHSQKHFDESCHHRDFDVVRTQPFLQGTSRNVRKDAEELEKVNRERLQINMRKLSEFNKIAADRYKHAITTVGMDRRKSKLFEEMKELESEDRSRKQHNATKHASTFRSHFVHSGVDKLTRVFQSQFQIGYTNGIMDGMISSLRS
jgi:hypothetical protein